MFKRECHYVTRHSVFTHLTGVYKGISCSPIIQRYVTNIEEHILFGENVEASNDGTDILAFVDLEFETYELQHQYSEELEQYIKPIIE